jgi:hypothetical protein
VEFYTIKFPDCIYIVKTGKPLISLLPPSIDWNKLISTYPEATTGYFFPFIPAFIVELIVCSQSQMPSRQRKSQYKLSDFSCDGFLLQTPQNK